MTRGIRNNNPLNIRYVESNQWQGRVLIKKDKSFEEFISMYYGFRAALITIRNYMRRHQCNTPAKIIARWAPPSENHTDNYIRHVCLATGIGGNENLAPNNPKIKEMVKAMAVMESGNGIRDYFDEADKAWDDLPPVTTQKKC